MVIWDSGTIVILPKLPKVQIPTMADIKIALGSSRRNDGIDLLRATITAVVVAFHSVLGYVTFGVFDPADYFKRSTAPVVDQQQWIGFDLFFAFNNTFFMSLMFFISGLFVVPSLNRKGVVSYLKDKAWRLGAPFLLGMFFLSPLAYYPSFLLTGSDKGYLAYWRDMILEGPWPTGPLWFISMLLAFHLFVAPAYLFIKRFGIWECSSTELLKRVRREPVSFFLVAVVLCIGSYLPLLFLYGPFLWVFFGPFCFNASRFLLFLSNFGLGVYLGAQGLEATFLGNRGTFGRRWPVWLFLSGAFFIWFLVANKSMLEHFDVKNEIWSQPPGWLSNGLGFATCTATISLCALALFHHFTFPPSRLLDSLRANAYGIYLIHYPFVVWTQYFLLGWPLGAIGKATIVFVVSLSGSWGVVAMLRRIPVVSRII